MCVSTFHFWSYWNDVFAVQQSYLRGDVNSKHPPWLCWTANVQSPRHSTTSNVMPDLLPPHTPPQSRSPPTPQRPQDKTTSDEVLLCSSVPALDSSQLCVRPCFHRYGCVLLPFCRAALGIVHLLARPMSAMYVSLV